MGEYGEPETGYVEQDIADTTQTDGVRRSNNSTLVPAFCEEPSPPVYDSEQRIIKNYKIINYIGQGSFGKVYLCEHIHSKVQYAMKVQDKQMVDENDCIKFLQSEQRILKKISTHPFIVHMRESFQNENKLFLILEYASAGNLSRVLKR